MRKCFLLVFCTLNFLISFAQQGYYLYLQSDNRQPFYARVSGKLFSSSENGYLIIPRLGDSTYQVTVGFAKDAAGEQNFSVPMSRTDKGFQLKNFGDKGWGMVNIQNAAVIMSQAGTVKASENFAGAKKTDGFSELLANVVNDSAILYTAAKPKPVEAAKTPATTPAVNEEIKKPAAKDSPDTKSIATVPATPQGVAQKDSNAANTGDQVTASSPVLQKPDTASIGKKEEVVVAKKIEDNSKQAQTVTASPTVTSPSLTPNKQASAAPADDKPFITKIDEQVSGNAYRAVYLEQYNLRTDTINILIGPEDQTITSPATKAETTGTREPTTKNPTPVQNEPAISAGSPIVAKQDTVKKQTIDIINSDCKNFANDNDVDKFRVRLIADETIEQKIATAKKFFKSKCHSVKQVRALAELFPSDETRLRFFTAAYPFVSDTSNFYLLQDALDAPLYRNQFRELVK